MQTSTARTLQAKAHTHKKVANSIDCNKSITMVFDDFELNSNFWNLLFHLFFVYVSVYVFVLRMGMGKNNDKHEILFFFSKETMHTSETNSSTCVSSYSQINWSATTLIKKTQKWWI